MKAIYGQPIRRILKMLAYMTLGGSSALVIVGILYLNSRPELDVWHTADLDAEFTEASKVQNFDGYLALEKRLFAQLDERVHAQIAPEDRRRINRYHRGSLSDPARWPRNWNRTYELPSNDPRMGVLLLHGMSDSPYSLRNVGLRLHKSGAWVVGLRSPGHGTAPSGLVSVKWEDMAAAMELALQHLREKTAGKPIFIVGYSTGAALAVQHALRALAEPDLPAVSGLVLISPSIGVTGAAALAVWQARIGHLLGLDKLAWNSLGPEYDPFKYNSFAVNAGDQVYRLTLEIQSRLEKLGKSGGLKTFPPVLAFQSIVDATVSTPAVVNGLFKRLPPGGHELILFDINRRAEVEELLSSPTGTIIKPLLTGAQLPFAFSLVTNKNNENAEVLVRHRPAGRDALSERSLGLDWPGDLYSLSHVALPFPGSDPVYGGTGAGPSPGIHLGSLVVRGERNILQISATDLLRLRWNPFYTYMEGRLLEFVNN